jgi:hypothetical protein
MISRHQEQNVGRYTLRDVLDWLPLQHIGKPGQLGVVLLGVRAVGVGNGIDRIPVDEKIGWPETSVASAVN